MNNITIDDAGRNSSTFAESGTKISNSYRLVGKQFKRINYPEEKDLGLDTIPSPGMQLPRSFRVADGIVINIVDESLNKFFTKD